jgi:hypothetical protein
VSAWTIERVEQLAPDAAALKAAQSVARPAKWSNLGREEPMIWGECQGSGATPYQVRVHLDDVAYKCSCPSRKLPCKHTLGLLLLYAGGASFPPADVPGFVREWTATRERRAQTRVEKARSPDRAPDPKAQATRTEKRAARVESGLEQLEAWLQDLVLQGLAAARAQPAAFWRQMSARLVDAQAPGLARRVDELAELALSTPDWQTGLLAGLSRLQLLIDASRRLDVLPDSLAAEVRTAIGWTQNQEVLLQREGVRDRWQVLGRRQTASERIRIQHTWLAGWGTGRMALLLDFAAGNQPLPAAAGIGQVFEAALVFFDGAPELRALVQDRLGEGGADSHLPGPRDVASLQNEFARLLAINPWLDRWPAVLGPLLVEMSSGRCELIDAGGRRVLTPARFRHAWPLVSLAGGRPVTLFGEWDGSVFHPVSVEHEAQLFSVTLLGDLPILARVA